MRAIGVALVLLLASCMDQDPFGVTTRRIAGPYELKRWDEGPVQYLIQGGPRTNPTDWTVDGPILQLAWDRHHILVQRAAFAGGDTAWVVIDVARRSVTGPLTEAAARRLPGVGTLRAMSADSAWARL
jgi:hypothetical protein